LMLSRCKSRWPVEGAKEMAKGKLIVQDASAKWKI
jgi:hypothetical protein